MYIHLNTYIFIHISTTGIGLITQRTQSEEVNPTSTDGRWWLAIYDDDEPPVVLFSTTQHTDTLLVVFVVILPGDANDSDGCVIVMMMDKNTQIDQWRDITTHRLFCFLIHLLLSKPRISPPHHLQRAPLNRHHMVERVIRRRNRRSRRRPCQPFPDGNVNPRTRHSTRTLHTYFVLFFSLLDVAPVAPPSYFIIMDLLLLLLVLR